MVASVTFKTKCIVVCLTNTFEHLITANLKAGGDSSQKRGGGGGFPLFTPLSVDDLPNQGRESFDLDHNRKTSGLVDESI